MKRRQFRSFKSITNSISHKRMTLPVSSCTAKVKTNMKGIIMKKSYLIIMLLVTEMFLFGCATTKSQVPFFEEKPKSDQDVIVYVYRLNSFVGAAANWNVRIDGEVVGILNQGAYMAMHVNPGVHTIKIGESFPFIEGAIVEAIANNPGAFNAEETKTYYVRCAGFAVDFVTKEKAMTELPSMKYDMGM